MDVYVCLWFLIKMLYCFIFKHSCEEVLLLVSYWQRSTVFHRCLFGICRICIWKLFVERVFVGESHFVSNLPCKFWTVSLEEVRQPQAKNMWCQKVFPLKRQQNIFLITSQGGAGRLQGEEMCSSPGIMSRNSSVFRTRSILEISRIYLN